MRTLEATSAELHRPEAARTALTLALAALAALAAVVPWQAFAAPLAEYGYRCADGRGFDVAYVSGGGAGSALVTMQGGTRVLPQVPAASGVRYADGAWTLAGRGLVATLEGPSGGLAPFRDCAATVRRTVDTVTGLRFDWPARWSDARVATFATEGDPGPAGAPVRYDFVYQPDDTALPRAVLASVIAYPRATWTALPTADRAKAGSEAATTESRVFVVGMPVPNPYPARSEDGRRFASLAPGHDEMMLALAPLGPPSQRAGSAAQATQPQTVAPATAQAPPSPQSTQTAQRAQLPAGMVGSPPANVSSGGAAAAVLPLRCSGNEPSWNLQVGADGSGAFTRMASGGPRTAKLQGSLTRVDWLPPGHAVWRGRSGSDIVWVATLRAERCPDTMSDGVEGAWRVLLSTPRDEVLVGCCRAEAR